FDLVSRIHGDMLKERSLSKDALTPDTAREGLEVFIDNRDDIIESVGQLFGKPAVKLARIGKWKEINPKITLTPGQLVRPLWSVTKKWYLQGSVLEPEEATQIHERSVNEALREGKPVPPEVLADYPELQAEQKTEPPEAKAPKKRLGRKVEPKEEDIDFPFGANAPAESVKTTNLFGERTFEPMAGQQKGLEFGRNLEGETV